MAAKKRKKTAKKSSKKTAKKVTRKAAKKTGRRTTKKARHTHIKRHASPSPGAYYGPMPIAAVNASAPFLAAGVSHADMHDSYFRSKTKRRTAKSRKSAATAAIKKARRRRIRHHAPPAPTAFHGPLPRKVERYSRKMARRGVPYATLHDSYLAYKAYSNKQKTKPAKKRAKKTETVTANQVIGRASKESKYGKLKMWICAGKSRTGCGGGRKGGHVMGILR